MVDTFRHLSCKLCSDESLAASLAEEYFLLLSPLPHFSDLIIAYEAIINQDPGDILQEIKNQLLSNADYRLVIKIIIRLWFLGKLDGLTILKGSKHYYYYDALIWKVLHAHPAGLSGGYFGYWAYKPET